MCRQHRIIASIAAAAAFAVSVDLAGAQSLSARIRAIRSANTADAALQAYRSAVRENRTSLAAREAFVQRLVALGKPARAHSAARLLVAMDDDNAAGWSAILLTQVHREQFADAIETLASQVETLRSRQEVLAPAGRLVAWYQEHHAHSAAAWAVRREVDVIRSVFGRRKAYRAARDAEAARLKKQRPEPSAPRPAPVAVRKEDDTTDTPIAPARPRREDVSARDDHGRALLTEDDQDDQPLIGVDNPPLSTEDFTISRGLHIGVSHAWSNGRAHARWALDPQVSNLFGGTVIGLRGVAVPSGRYVTLSGGGATFTHGTFQVIPIPTIILLGNEDRHSRIGDGWTNRRTVNRPAPTTPTAPAKPAVPDTKSSGQTLPPWQRQPQKSATENIVRKRLLERSRQTSPTRSRPRRTTVSQPVGPSRRGWGSSTGQVEGTWGNP